MLVGLTGWAATIAAYIIQGQLPDALLLGVPAGLILALAPPVRSFRRNNSEDNERDDGTDAGDVSPVRGGG